MTEQNHDIVTIGASAGGVEAVGDVLALLPRDLPAAIFVVVHVAPGFQSRLPDIFAKRGPLAATHAVHGEDIERGHVYVAPPDNHMLVRPGVVHVVRGPKENGHRPAVDALFRSAANAYGARVIAVVLTGFLDCGTGGARAVKARGGVTLAQDPRTAAARDMPASAIRHAQIDHVLPIPQLAEMLEREVRRTVAAQPASPPNAPEESVAELVCPACQGRLTTFTEGDVTSFRCHVGHAFSLDALVAEQAESLERALWSGARALEESAALARRLAERSSGSLRARFEEKARVQQQQAETIRRVLLDPDLLRRDDAYALAHG